VQGVQGPAGPAGAVGPTGPQGPSGVISSVYANGGSLVNPVDGAAYAFIGTTAIISVTAANQVLYVSAEKALGSTIAGGANNLTLSICRRISGSGATPVDNGADYLFGLRIGQNQRLPFSLTTRFSGLAVGSYEVGLCGYTAAGNAVNWNNNEWSRVSAFVAQQ
jgi:hypothetical protein